MKHNSIKILQIILLLMTIVFSSITLVAEEKQDITPKQILITNIKIFDGRSKVLKSGPVLIEGNLIKAIGSKVENIKNIETIDGGGRTLMPGLIDAHWHTMMSNISQNIAMTGNIGYINHVAAVGAKETLLRGFTTVRDMGGPVFGLKQAIDEGLVIGPRIYPSGALISQTSGHADFRPATAAPESPGTPLSYAEQEGFFALADGVPQVLKEPEKFFVREHHK